RRTPCPVPDIDNAIRRTLAATERVGALVGMVVVLEGHAYAITLEERQPMIAHALGDRILEGADRGVGADMVDREEVRYLAARREHPLQPLRLEARDRVGVIGI